MYTQNHENVVRCRGEIEDGVSSGVPRVSDGMIGYLVGSSCLIDRMMHLPGALRLSNILSNRSIGMSATPSSTILTAQTNSESVNPLGSELATGSLPTLHETYPHTDSTLPISADPASTSPHIAAGLSRRTSPQGDSIGAYDPISHTDVTSDIADPEIDRPYSASSGVASPTPYETYHAIDAPVRFILPVVSFLVTSYLPQIREVILVVDDDDDDKAALQDAVARSAANLPADLGFRVAN